MKYREYFIEMSLFLFPAFKDFASPIANNISNTFIFN